MRTRQIFSWLVVSLPWIGAFAVLGASALIYDPYLAPVRYQAFRFIPALCCVAVLTLLIRGSWTRKGIVGRLLALLWCAPPIALLGVQWNFEARKQAVLSADAKYTRELGDHFIVGYSSLAQVAPLVAKGLIGGIYVSRHNIKGRTAESLKLEISGLQRMRRDAGLPPLTVAADQEGGIVSHLSPQLTSLPALATLAELPPDTRSKKAEEFGEVHGRELAETGVTLNFAPVADLRPAEPRIKFDFNSLIGRRAISDDPASVKDVASAYIRGLAKFGIGATVKHFPGLGRVREDTHHFRASLDASVDELEATDWQPFRQLLAQPNARLMVGHVAVTAIDGERPASHSKRIIDGVIRKGWGYQGIIVTDDMVMSAVYQHGICTAVIEALNAGVDQLLVAFDSAQYFRIFECALSGLKRGEIDKATLAKSQMRLNAVRQPIS